MTSKPMPSVSRVLLATLQRDLLTVYRRASELMNPIVFFIMVCSLFPLGIAPEASVLRDLAGGIIWVVALLACLLSMDGLFRRDYDDGSLEQALLSPQPVYWLALAKNLAHWLLTGLPLTLISPLLAVMLSLPVAAMPALVLSLLLGTLSMSFIGSIGAALIVGLRKGGVLISLITLPLYVPILIFGTSAVQNALEGGSYTPHLAILLAFALLSATLAPLASAGALKISVDV